MRTLRGGRGLGDSIYLQSIAHFLTRSDQERLCVATDYPALFEQMGRRIKTIPFTRQGVTIVAHYVARKQIYGTSQFTDMCMQAGLHAGSVALHLDWKCTDEARIAEVKARGRPYVCVQLPRAPMGRIDGFGAELLPDCNAIQKALDAIGQHATLVQIGAGRPLFEFTGIDLDLADKTTISQLVDIVQGSAGVVGYPSFIVPLAESLERRSLLFWSRAGLRSPTPFISSICPQKIVHKTGLATVVKDNATDQEIIHAARTFLGHPQAR